jgi:hypothetical protein
VYVTVTSNTIYNTSIKTTVSDEESIIYPRTTNTLITMYYFSYDDNYIPTTTDAANRNLVSYDSTAVESVPIICDNSY